MSLSVRPNRFVVGVEPGQPVFETAEDFPGDGLAAFAPVARGDFLVSVRAQQGHHRAQFEAGTVGGINHELVHGDRPHLG